VIIAWVFLGGGFGVGIMIGLTVALVETRNAGPVGHGGGLVVAWYVTLGGFVGLCAGALGFIWWLGWKS
jgi:hypothetical protein